MPRLAKLILALITLILLSFATPAVNAATLIIGPSNDLSRYPIGLDPASASTAFPDFAAVQLKWAEVEREQVEFVNRVTNESLGRMIPVRTTQISLAHLMQHLANHSTYHRGQVAL